MATTTTPLLSVAGSRAAAGYDPARTQAGAVVGMVGGATIGAGASIALTRALRSRGSSPEGIVALATLLPLAACTLAGFWAGFEGSRLLAR